MTMDRLTIEALLEEYALDLLDQDRTSAVEEGLGAYPDLRRRVDELRLAVAALADQADEPPPDRLWSSVIERALVERAAGRGQDTPGPASGPAAYIEAADALGSLLDRVGAEEWRSMTAYGIPVVELVENLAVAGGNECIEFLVELRGRHAEDGA